MHNHFAIQQNRDHCFSYFYLSKMCQLTIPVEWIDEDAKHTLNHVNGKTYSSFNLLQHKIAWKITNEKGSRAIKLQCLQIHDEKHWQCAWDHWKSITENRGWYRSEFTTSKTPRIRVVCVMNLSNVFGRITKFVTNNYACYYRDNKIARNKIIWFVIEILVVYVVFPPYELILTIHRVS